MCSLHIDSEMNGKVFLNLNQVTEVANLFKMKIHEATKVMDVILSLVKCHVVKAEIKDAIRRKGIRASLFKKAEEFLAFYYPHDESQSICYNGSDLNVTLLFKDEWKAGEFRVSLSQWKYHNPLAAKGLDISVNELLAEVHVEKSKLRPVMLSHYQAAESDSPVQTLADFEGCASSISNISVSIASLSDPICQFQSIEKPEIFQSCEPYKMHIKPKRFKKVASDDNNLLIGTWTPFHQMYDGLKTNDAVPLVAIKPVSESDFEGPLFLGVPPQKRFKVDIELEFSDENSASQFSSNLKDGSIKVSETIWRSSVFMKNPEKFCENLKWKWDDTKRMWKERDED
ncbi:hypothetical protein SPBRAN_859 [uncultured Candidatus Thioglobus sp.]|nr:hypothetical protein SPBRAN_859 [uncultured Candidatus Thioglobus sp.]